MRHAMNGELVGAEETQCDSCGNSPIDLILMGYKEEGSLWQFALCRACSDRWSSQLSVET
jgi:hypothetical protein